MQRQAHPYMANSAPGVKEEMLAAVGVASTDELYEQIPANHRLEGGLNLPPTLRSEVDLRRHMTRTLAKNGSCEENLSFLGQGAGSTTSPPSWTR